MCFEYSANAGVLSVKKLAPVIMLFVQVNSGQYIKIKNVPGLMPGRGIIYVGLVILKCIPVIGMGLLAPLVATFPAVTAPVAVSKEHHAYAYRDKHQWPKQNIIET